MSQAEASVVGFHSTTFGRGENKFMFQQLIFLQMFREEMPRATVLPAFHSQLFSKKVAKTTILPAFHVAGFRRD